MKLHFLPIKRCKNKKNMQCLEVLKFLIIAAKATFYRLLLSFKNDASFTPRYACFLLYANYTLYFTSVFPESKFSMFFLLLFLLRSMHLNCLSKFMTLLRKYTDTNELRMILVDSMIKNLYMHFKTHLH